MIGESEKLKIAVKITRLNEIDIVRSIIIKRYFFFFHDTSCYYFAS